MCSVYAHTNNLLYIQHLIYESLGDKIVNKILLYNTTAEICYIVCTAEIICFDLCDKARLV